MLKSYKEDLLLFSESFKLKIKKNIIEESNSLQTAMILD